MSSSRHPGKRRAASRTSEKAAVPRAAAQHASVATTAPATSPDVFSPVAGASTSDCSAELKARRPPAKREFARMASRRPAQKSARPTLQLNFQLASLRVFQRACWVAVEELAAPPTVQLTAQSQAARSVARQATRPAALPPGAGTEDAALLPVDPTVDVTLLGRFDRRPAAERKTRRPRP